MDNKDFAKNLEKRTKLFAVMVVKFILRLPRSVAGDVIGRQLLSSGTSVGANYREANRSVSHADFKNRIAICEKEASEAQYWLEVLLEAEVVSQEKTGCIYKECCELVAIFTSIGKKLRR